VVLQAVNDADHRRFLQMQNLSFKFSFPFSLIIILPSAKTNEFPKGKKTTVLKQSFKFLFYGVCFSQNPYGKTAASELQCLSRICPIFLG
jgi:hypothetical protein